MLMTHCCNEGKLGFLHTHTHTNTHTSSLPLTVLYRQIKGISVEAVKPVTPSVFCVRQSKHSKKVQQGTKESIKEKSECKKGARLAVFVAMCTQWNASRLIALRPT